jgi:2-polyprenyl-6-hydroxyphenyl methylase / 3-demethylubiquinone-9 3-methyltransferase
VGVCESALDVGWGGGTLAEEFAATGFRVTGVDPSEKSLAPARQHAQSIGWPIDDQKGSGESIPFPDDTYPVVYCCDVLEHVRDLPKVMGEIYRVTKPGGVFFFDTLNRTLISKLVAIKIWQEWKSTAFMPPRLWWEGCSRRQPARLIPVAAASPRVRKAEWIEPAQAFFR